MTDKVQKIREEVEKRYECWKEKESNSHSIESEIRMSECQHLLLMLDSLQEEPVSKVWHDASEEPKPNMELICVGQYGNPLVLSSNSNSFKSRDISKWAYFNDLINLSNVEKTVKNWNEPVSEEFEMALAEMIDKAQKCVVEPWVVAAQWKDELVKLAKGEEPVSEDLEEASKEWLSPQLDKSYAAYGETKQMELTHFDGYAMLDAIEFGAKWQKEKMMAKAVDGDITFDYYGDDDKTYGCIAHDSFCLEDFGLKDTDKVKMILFKED